MFLSVDCCKFSIMMKALESVSRPLDSARDSIFYSVHRYMNGLHEKLVEKHFGAHQVPDHRFPQGLRIRDFAISGEITTALTAGKHLHERGHLEHTHTHPLMQVLEPCISMKDSWALAPPELAHCFRSAPSAALAKAFSGVVWPASTAVRNPSLGSSSRTQTPAMVFQHPI